MGSTSGGRMPRICFQPDNLQQLCRDFIALNLTETIAHEIPSQDLLELRSDVFLPAETAEGIISAYISEGLILTDKVIHLLRDAKRTKICSIDLSQSQITDWSLQWLSQHPITRLDISGCNELSQQRDIQKHIAKIQSTLRVLVLGDKSDLFLSDRPFSVDETMEEVLTPQQTFAAEAVDCPPPSDSLPSSFCQPEDERSSDEEELTVPKLILDAPNLSVLCVNDVKKSGTLQLQRLLKPLQNLQCLDLSDCHFELPTMYVLRSLPLLNSLTLHNVLPQGFNLNYFLPMLIRLTKLCHLDISIKRNRNLTTHYPPMTDQDKALSILVESLPKLASLDISGTHLAGLEQPETKDSDYIPIPAFKGRHFEFLGLFDCVDDVCSRRNLPADRVTGRNNINQLLEALRVYTKRRPSYTSDALTHLYTDLKEGPRNQIKDYSECLHLICDVMRRSKDNLDLQILASAAMYYMVSSRVTFPDLHEYASPRLIRKAVRTLYDAMDTHFGDKAMLKNGLLTLCNFTLPEDIVFIYKDIVVILLLVIRHSEDSFLQRISLYVLNNVVRSVDNVEKLLVGDQGAVKTMLWVIRNKVGNEGKPDEILEMAWSALWNITDETPQNCQRFLDGDGDGEGLRLFIKCYDKFCVEGPPRTDGFLDLETPKLRESVLRNMMGLLGNVAEVQSLRQRFLQPTYLNLFRELLGSRSDGIEVSYNAAGIICHILYDGHDLSGYVKPDTSITQSTHHSAYINEYTGYEYFYSAENSVEGFKMMDSMNSDDEGASTSSTDRGNSGSAATNLRPAILQALTKAVWSWDTGTSRSINYRSFKPILTLLQCEHTIEVRYWAVWALCNLTTVSAQKYCPLLKEEGGIELIDKLKSNPQKQNKSIIQLIDIIQFNCKQYFDNPY